MGTFPILIEFFFFFFFFLLPNANYLKCVCHAKPSGNAQNWHNQLVPLQKTRRTSSPNCNELLEYAKIQVHLER